MENTFQSVELNCQFWYELERFKSSEGEDKYVNINDTKIPISLYNLMVSIRDVSLYNKGIVPNGSFNIKVLKEYFGFIGKDKNMFLEYLKDIKAFCMNEEGANNTMATKWGIIYDPSLN